MILLEFRAKFQIYKIIVNLFRRFKSVMLVVFCDKVRTLVFIINIVSDFIFQNFRERVELLRDVRHLYTALIIL